MDWRDLGSQLRKAWFYALIVAWIAGLITLGTYDREEQLNIAHGLLLYVIIPLLCLSPIMVILAWYGWRKPKDRRGR
jgi:hypothetical protein